MRGFHILLVCGGLVSSVRGEGCLYKECLCEGAEILCNNRYLTEMPKRLTDNNPYLTTLTLDSNEIRTILVGSLPANLSSISLKDNPIETIDDAAFDESIHTLQELCFSQARFTQMPDAIFQLKALTRLEIYQTYIQVWDESKMRQLSPKMNTFILDTVGLTIWPTWIKSMINLTQLAISGNSISSIPDNALDLVTGTLTVLDFHNNSLTTLPQSLSRMTVLSKLSLDHNRITNVTWLPQLSHLQTLSLNNNRITDAESLSSAVQSYANTLINFNIHDNRLTSIPKLSFMSHISNLDFSFNRIAYSNDGSVPSPLETLNMGNNFLPAIPRILTGLQLVSELFLDSNNIIILNGANIPASVTMLDLSFNQVSQLTRSSFPVNSTLNFLILNNNPLSIISTDAFSNLAILTELNLQSTKLTRLPLAITSLTHLGFIDFTGSTGLVCTCLERALGPQFVPMGSYSVIGQCGLTSVYDFLSVFGPQCP